MKSKTLRLIISIIVITCNLSLSACGNNKIGVSTNNQENTEGSLSTNDNWFISVEEQSKLLNEIEELSIMLSVNDDPSSIESVLSEYYDENKDTTSNIYYAKENGEFYLIPNTDLPEDYDPRKRVWYQSAFENTSNLSVYEDIVTEKKIITVSIVVSKDDKKIGVIGMDISNK